MIKITAWEPQMSGYIIGNCVDSFDENGKCVAEDLPYNDATDFAQDEENGFPLLAQNGITVLYNDTSDIHTFHKK